MKQVEPRLVEWRDGALRVMELAPQPPKRKPNWGRKAALAIAWTGLIVGMSLFLWFFAYGLAVIMG